MKRNSKLYFAFLLAIIVAILSISAFAASGNGDLIVYITATGGRYHSDGCGSLSRSKYEITLEKAIIEGYTPCDRCNPPVYTGDAVPRKTREVHNGGTDELSPRASEALERYHAEEKPSLFLNIVKYVLIGIVVIPFAVYGVLMLYFAIKNK